MWRHFPWLAGLLFAPLLLGSVTPDGQAVIGTFLAMSLVLVCWERGRFQSSGGAAILNWLAFLLLVLPMIPLPAGLLGWFDPQRLALAKEYPVETGANPAWLPLTLSAAGTINRWWEMSLIFAAFCLARHAAASRENFARWLAATVALGILLEAGSDVWYRSHNPKQILGLWPVSWGTAAGTFSNRNHFADWLVIAGLFVCGWMLRNVKPLHTARGERHNHVHRRPAEAVFATLAAGFGFLMALLSSSRGGALALVAGGVAGIVLLSVRSRRKGRWTVIGLALTAAVVVAIFTGGPLLQRLWRTGGDMIGGTNHYPKGAIWLQTLSLFQRFPVVGTGLGSFETALSHFKTEGGGYAILHVENEYLELLVETGIAGFLVFGLWLARLMWRHWKFALARKMTEPELVISALAALTGFAVHSCVEFVFHITATALLAGALAGFVAGCRDRARAPEVAPGVSPWRICFNATTALLLLAAAVAHDLSFWHWERARQARPASDVLAEFREAADCWPWNQERQIAFSRTLVATSVGESRAEQVRRTTEARRRLDRAIAWDPYAWALRLERAWLDLAATPTHRKGRDEAFETVRLNPLLPKIPLRFAGQFVENDPDFARQMLQSIQSPDGATVHEMLGLSWQISRQTGDLWGLTPDTVEGLTMLAGFGLRQGLPGLTVQAGQRLEGRANPQQLADWYMQAHRPELAVTLLERSPATPERRLMIIRAHIQMEDYTGAIEAAEAVWKRSRAKRKILTPLDAPGSLAYFLEAWKTDPRNRVAGLRLAEKLFDAPADQRDLPLLNQLADRFHDEPRLIWMVLQTQLDRHLLPAAAATALQLAAEVN